MNQIAENEQRALADHEGGELRKLEFDASFVRELPGDTVLTNVPRHACRRKTHARPVRGERSGPGRNGVRG